MLDELSKSLVKNGIKVIDLGLISTPLLYFAAKKNQNKSGIMITGSHNPPEFNGFKMSRNKKAVFGDSIQELKTIIETKDFEKGEGLEASYDILSNYKKMLLSKININKTIKIDVPRSGWLITSAIGINKINMGMIMFLNLFTLES